MKNIHVLPTEKPSIPSRLFYNEQESLIFSKKYSVFNGVNIYITDDSEIKEGDWFYDNDGELCKYTSDYNADPNDWEYNNKIILTTDQDLIKDGVQPIDDEFLEWFVKNPSCEYIKTEKWLDDEGGVLYSRIIPKEEPKQEALEEAAKYYAHNYFEMHDTNNYKALKQGFEAGAKWQQEQDKKMYSEEDIAIAFNEGQAYSVTGKLVNGKKWAKTHKKEWFEQFKKK